MRIVATLLLLTAFGACASAVTGPAGQPSRSNVNPETGSRGGSGAAN